MNVVEGLIDTFDRMSADGELSPQEADELVQTAKEFGITITFEVTAGKVVKDLKIAAIAGDFAVTAAKAIGLDKALAKLNDRFQTIGGSDKNATNDNTPSQSTNTGAANLNNGIRLNHQLAAEQIAGGHGFEKHVLSQGEFAGLGIRTRRQYQDHIENVLNNPSSVRYTSDGRSFHLQESTGTVVVRNPNALDGGTAFQPKDWNDFVSDLPTRTEPY